jgi:Ca2+-binding EF-hand superfamily protein
MSFEEIRDLLKKLGLQVSDEDLRKSFAELDSNKDGKVDMEEY